MARRRTRDLGFILLLAAAAWGVAARVFIPVTRGGETSAPAALERDSVARSVDDAMAQLRPAGVGIAPAAPPLAILRRLSLAMVGSIPSLEEVRVFEASGASQSIGAWADRLAGERRHAEYLAERLARIYVGTHIEPPNVFRRDMFSAWLADQIHARRPYDEWVREMIASHGVWTESLATNFLTSTCDFNTYEGPNKILLAGRVAQAFLGANLECAECHDHPFDRWTQRDFHGVAAFFDKTTRTFAGIIESPEGSSYQPAGVPVDPKTGEPIVASPMVFQRPDLLPSAGAPRERLAAWVTARENRDFARTIVNRLWTVMFTKPLVGSFATLPRDEPDPAALDLLVDDFLANGRDLSRTLAIIARTKTFQLDSRTGETSREAPPQSVADGIGATETWGHYPMSRLRPEQQVASIYQAASVLTVDGRRHFIDRTLTAMFSLRFRERFGDLGEKEFMDPSASVAQKLLMMNGEVVTWKTQLDPVNASGRIALAARDDAAAVEAAYLAVLTRRPTAEESRHFEGRLAGATGLKRVEAMEDLFWALLNSMEFSWNH